jgi:hypothetical protein
MLVILNQCETWSVTLREIHMQGVCENMVLWKIFVPKNDGIKEAQEDCVMRM